MKRKLLAAAIASVVVSPVVAADSNNVVIYGKAHVMLVNSDQDDIADSWEMGSTNSRLGFKGTEDLGNGLKAIWKYETTVNISDGGADGGTFGSARNAYVGLSGDWGTVLMGRHDTPYKVAWYATGNDHLDGSIIDFNDIAFSSGLKNPQSFKGFSADRRVDNAIAYISPSFNGLTVAAALVPGEQSGISPDDENDTIADSYSLGVMYDINGIKLAGGYESLGGPGGAGTDDEDDWFLGGSYTINGLTVGAVYESVSNYGFDSSADKDTWGLAGKYVFGNNAVIANYADGKVDAAGDTNYYDWGLALEHYFSKRTSVYVAYDDGKIDPPGGGNKVDSTQYGLGMIHTF